MEHSLIDFLIVTLPVGAIVAGLIGIYVVLTRWTVDNADSTEYDYNNTLVNVKLGSNIKVDFGDNCVTFTAINPEETEQND